MEQEPIRGNVLTTAAGVAGAGALLSPAGLPILPGLLGIAAVGAGMFTAGMAVKKMGEMISSGLNQSQEPREEDSPFM